MADLKISQLNSIVTVVPATDVLPVVQGGTTLKITPKQILESGSPAVLASATITGDLTVDTNVLKVDTTNNRVGIGTASPNYILDILGAAPRIHLKDPGTGSSLVDIENGAGTLFVGRENSTGSGGLSGVPYAGIMYLQGAYPLIFGTNLTERARLNSTGAFVLAGGTTTADGIGVAFPTTQVASSDANCLDDYEEGTFTPTVIGTTLAGVGVYSTQAGRYIKVGNLVTLQVYLNWTAHTGTGNMLFGNFPFTTSSTGYSAAAIGYASNIALTAGNILTAFASTSSTYVNAYQTPTGGGSVTDVPMDAAGQIIYTITYSV